MLRNLDDLFVSALANCLTTFGSSVLSPRHGGTLKSPSFRSQGKSLTIEHLRPISLPSCIGKVMEYIIQDVLQLSGDNNTYCQALQKHKNWLWASRSIRSGVTRRHHARPRINNPWGTHLQLRACVPHGAHGVSLNK